MSTDSKQSRAGWRPVILLTAGASEEETSDEENCAALEAGADSCLSKPFSPHELLARVQATLKRLVRPSPLSPADIVIDHGAMKLSVQGCEIVTTTLEFRLVDYFARHRGHVFYS